MRNIYNNVNKRVAFISLRLSYPIFLFYAIACCQPYFKDFDYSQISQLSLNSDSSSIALFPQELKKDQLCIKALLLLGDIASYKLSHDFNLQSIKAANKYYGAMLALDSINDTVLARNAFINELQGYDTSATSYYEKLSSSTHSQAYSAFIRSYRERRFLNDSLSSIFRDQQGNDSNYILFEIISFIEIGMYNRQYCRIRSNQKAEYFIYYGEPFAQPSFEIKIAESLIDTIATLLQTARFFSLYNPFTLDSNDVDLGISNFATHYEPSYRITVQAKGINHTLKIRGINAFTNALFGDLPENDSSDSVKAFNVAFDYLGKAMRCAIETSITEEINKKYGNFLLPIYGQEGILYIRNDRSIIKLVTPTAKPKWKRTLSTKKSIGFIKTMVFGNKSFFIIGDSLYAIYNDNGKTAFVMNLDLINFPYVIATSERIFYGKNENSIISIKEFDARNGVYLRTVKSDSEGKAFQILHGRNISAYQRAGTISQIKAIAQGLVRNMAKKYEQTE